MNPARGESEATNALPKVTFVVPCFKLAHFLRECVDSILRQTYGNFEVLIMDDSSPDETEAVAHSYQDRRVKYVRNEQNLGNIRNYNKGIGLARGEYVWLISADDCLKQPYVLSRYVDVMEKNEKVGFIFSPAIALRDGREGEVIRWTTYRDEDAIVSGQHFLTEIMSGNCVAAPAAMVRKVCYERISLFPVDLFHTGDWYLWCLFALHFDVAYLAEPMTFYRTHGENMSLVLRKVDEKIVRENLRLARWRLRAKALEAGARNIVRQFDAVLGNKYANEIARKIYQTDAAGITVDDFEEALQRNVSDSHERSRLRAVMHGALGDQAYQVANAKDARLNYAASLREDWLQPKLWVKQLLLSTGALGAIMRRIIGTVRGV